VNYAVFSYSTILFLIIALTSSPAPYLTDNLRQSIHDASINQVNKSIVIVIDPGHGGKDQGCSSHSNKEKSFTLPFAMKLGDKIQYHSQNAVQVLFTRSHDISLSLSKRTQIANAAKADLFISVHANSIDDPKIHGFETYVYGNPDPNSSELERSNEFSSIGEQENVTDHILAGLNKSNHLKESILLAKAINGKMKNSAELKNRGVKQAQFKVLKNANMPSVLLEMGYLTNTKDASLLLSEKGQNLCADKIAKAVLEYLKVL